MQKSLGQGLKLCHSSDNTILTPLSHQGTPISSLLLGNRCTERLGDLPKVLEFEPLWPDFRVGGINFCPCLEVNSPILLQTG